MKRQKLTEAEERRLAEAIAAEARALGLTKKDKMPQETKRRLRARILKAILDERTASGKQPWLPDRNRTTPSPGNHCVVDKKIIGISLKKCQKNIIKKWKSTHQIK
ncbi:hypothetical protein CRJUMX01_1970002 [Escherichia coli]|nr:hypothetical protein [Escherichia coli]VEW02849.1 hypothetical protein CRJUMX01_1970002 [Escherichia coli]